MKKDVFVQDDSDLSNIRSNIDKSWICYVDTKKTPSELQQEIAWILLQWEMYFSPY